MDVNWRADLGMQSLPTPSVNARQVVFIFFQSLHKHLQLVKKPISCNRFSQFLITFFLCKTAAPSDLVHYKRAKVTHSGAWLHKTTRKQQQEEIICEVQTSRRNSCTPFSEAQLFNKVLSSSKEWSKSKHTILMSECCNTTRHGACRF